VIYWNTSNPNKVFGAHEKDIRSFYKIEIAQRKGEQIPEKLEHSLKDLVSTSTHF
jgi:hypothetical protein